MISGQLEELEHKGLGKLLLKYFFCGLCFYLLIGLIKGLETSIDGYYGNAELNVILNTNLIINIFLATGSIIGIGGSVLLTIKLALKDKDKAEEVLGNSIALFIVFSLVLFLLAYFYKDFIFNKFIHIGNEQLKTMTITYFIARLSGVTFILMAEYLILFIVAAGNPLKALLLKFISFILKTIVLLSCLMFNLGFVYRAIMLNLVDLIIVLLILKHFTKRKGNILKLKWNNLKFKKTSLYIFIIGLFPFLFFLTQRFYDIGINYLVNFNNEQLISIGIIKRSLYSPVLTILSALAWLRPIFAYNYIKNNFVRIKKLFLYCTLILFLILIVVFIPLVFTKKIINLFTHDFAKISIAKKLIKNYIFITPLILFKTIIFVYLQSTSKKLKLALIYLSNILLIIIPLYLIWRFHLEIGFDGWLYLNNTIAFLMFIVSLIFFIIEFKKLNSKPQDREDDENCIKKKLLNVT